MRRCAYLLLATTAAILCGSPSSTELDHRDNINFNIAKDFDPPLLIRIAVGNDHIVVYHTKLRRWFGYRSLNEPPCDFGLLPTAIYQDLAALTRRPPSFIDVTALADASQAMLRAMAFSSGGWGTCRGVVVLEENIPRAALTYSGSADVAPARLVLLGDPSRAIHIEAFETATASAPSVLLKAVAMLPPTLDTIGAVGYHGVVFEGSGRLILIGRNEATGALVRRPLLSLVEARSLFDRERDRASVLFRVPASSILLEQPWIELCRAAAFSERQWERFIRQAPSLALVAHTPID
jgi:hypothetical protein